MDKKEAKEGRNIEVKKRMKRKRRDKCECLENGKKVKFIEEKED